MSRSLLLPAAMLVGVLLTALAPSALAASSSTARVQPKPASLSPEMYATVSTGVGRIITRDCSGRTIGQGTGFLIGSRVMMTAWHVLDSHRICSTKVTMGGRSYAAERTTSWYAGRPKTRDAVDLATVKLNRPAVGHVFGFAHAQPSRGETIATIGHPLGNPLSLSQGKFLGTRSINGVPMLGMWMLAAQGASGSPLLNASGKVIGILQQGYTREDEGRVWGINLLRAWGPTITKDLCRTYPSGGIAACGSSSPPQLSNPSVQSKCSRNDSEYLRLVRTEWRMAAEDWATWNRGDTDISVFDVLSMMTYVWMRDQENTALPCSAAVKSAARELRGLQVRVTDVEQKLEQSRMAEDLARAGEINGLGEARNDLSASIIALDARVAAINRAFRQR
jgi:V8-like Glu-specific endopeptidase